MYIAMNRFRVAKGSETAFEQVWIYRDSHLDKVPSDSHKVYYGIFLGDVSLSIPSSKISYLAANSQPQFELFIWELTPRFRHIRIGSAEPCGLGPASTGEIAMHRRHFKRTQSLEERLAQEAKRLREEAKLLPPGALREELIRRARHAETASHLNEWLMSPGLRPPE
jgi:hypothetical protein